MKIEFEEIDYFYNTKLANGERLWDINRVKDAVRLNKIKIEKFKKITGEDYIA